MLFCNLWATPNQWKNTLSFFKPFAPVIVMQLWRLPDEKKFFAEKNEIQIFPIFLSPKWMPSIQMINFYPNLDLISILAITNLIAVWHVWSAQWFPPFHHRRRWGNCCLLWWWLRQEVWQPQGQVCDSDQWIRKHGSCGWIWFVPIKWMDPCPWYCHLKAQPETLNFIIRFGKKNNIWGNVS